MHYVLFVQKSLIVITITLSDTGASKKITQEVENLYKTICICYILLSWKNIEQTAIVTLIDFGIEVNTINYIYTTKLDPQVKKTDVATQKIDNFSQETYGIIIFGFQIHD